MRVFVAVELEEPVLDRIEALLDELRADLSEIRWTGRESHHITLKFMGEVDESRLPALCDRLEEVARGTTPFGMEVEGLGTFGDRKRPRVVWAGIQERTGALSTLQAAVEEAVASEGIETEERPFRPHLTLARLKRSHSSLGRALARRSGMVFGTTRVTGMTLLQSRLNPGGAVYSAIRSFPFGEPDSEAAA